MPTQVIFTANPLAATAAWDELIQADPTTALSGWLADGIGLVTMQISWGKLAATLQSKPPVFLRHIFPAYASIFLENTASDLEVLADQALDFVPNLDRKATFSVQTRLVGELQRPYGRFEINNALAEALQKRGFNLDVRAPHHAVSVVCGEKQAWLGVSTVKENLSDWAGGEHRFKVEPGQISRAEFKLMEAIEVGGLHLPTVGQALDLGAAPGGWTRVLCNLGLRVVAVDPAELDPRVARLYQVTHMKKAAQDVRFSDASFDVLVNDMRMDALDSVYVMGLFEPVLKPGGIGVMTMKLPEQFLPQAARSALKQLERRFTVLGARQLFHNRAEITAWFTRKG